MTYEKNNPGEILSSTRHGGGGEAEEHSYKGLFRNEIQEATQEASFHELIFDPDSSCV